jgi:hypothetical protein
MHATIQKPMDEILGNLKPGEKVFVVGCGNCAAKCHSGGEPETKGMAERLKSKGVDVVGWGCSASGISLCKMAIAKKLLTEENKAAAEQANSFLVLSCGQGNHAVIDATNGGKIHPGCDTIFGGETITDNFIAEYCSLCGECVVEQTGGLCPVTLCSKSLLNGPCGGAKNGKCEVDKTRDCGWQLIYDRLNKLGSLDKMEKYLPPKNNAKRSHPRSLTLGDGEATFKSEAGERKVVSRA